MGCGLPNRRVRVDGKAVPQMKRTPRIGTFVTVTWDDAYAVLNAEGAEDDSYVITTIGWLVRATEASLFVANERLPREQGYRGYTRIPRAVVVSVKQLSRTGEQP